MLVSELSITVLGCSNAWAAPGEATSGYLVQTDTTNLLLDCGHGVVSKLREHLEPQMLDAVWLSHLHADHCADLISLAYLLRFHPHPQQGTRPRLFVPESDRPRLRQLGEAFGDGEVFDKAFDVYGVKSAEQLTVHDLTLCGVSVPHPLPTLAVDVRSGDGGRVTYGADSGPSSALTELAADTPLLLIEATLPEADADHLSALAAGQLARRARAGRCVLIHVCDAFDLSWVREQGEAGFGAPVTIARAGMKLIA